MGNDEDVFFSLSLLVACQKVLFEFQNRYLSTPYYDSTSIYIHRNSLLACMHEEKKTCANIFHLYLLQILQNEMTKEKCHAILTIHLEFGKMKIEISTLTDERQLFCILSVWLTCNGVLVIISK